MQTTKFTILSEHGFRRIEGVSTGKSWACHYYERNADDTARFEHYDAFTDLKSAVVAARAWATGY